MTKFVRHLEIIMALREQRSVFLLCFLCVCTTMVWRPGSGVTAADAGVSPPGGPAATTGENAVIQAFVIPHSHMDVGWIYTVQVEAVSRTSTPDGVFY